MFLSWQSLRNYFEFKFIFDYFFGSFLFEYICSVGFLNILFRYEKQGIGN